jgi:hypothetical protein
MELPLSAMRYSRKRDATLSITLFFVPCSCSFMILNQREPIIPKAASGGTNISSVGQWAPSPCVESESSVSEPFPPLCFFLFFPNWENFYIFSTRNCDQNLKK